MTKRDQKNDDDTKEKKKEPPLCNFPGLNDSSCAHCTCPAYREDASDPNGLCINTRPGKPWHICGHSIKEHNMPGC
ncbi:hypothetical protein ACF8D3_13490 [Acinetobacter sp. YQ_14]|uniref:hypothetical protein n=1 Tax=Acinetobacter sp. YQ_14 TaxID=3367236 RepID=UPI00370BF4A4